jgi:hypothetical protein
LGASSPAPSAQRYEYKMNIDQKSELRKLLLELWDVPDENRVDTIFELVNQLSPDPEWSDHIYHSEEYVNKSDGSLKIEELIEKILNYKAIIL